MFNKTIFNFYPSTIYIDYCSDRSILRLWRNSGVSKLAASLVEADVSMIVISLDKSWIDAAFRRDCLSGRSFREIQSISPRHRVCN